MTGTSRYNDQIPTDPQTALVITMLASALLAKTLTQEEISNLVAIVSLGLNAIPYLRR